MKPKLLSLSLLVASAFSYANTELPAPISERLTDQHTPMSSRDNLTDNAPQSRALAPQTAENTAKMTLTELAAHPDLILRALLPALYSGNANVLKMIYPLYQQLPASQQLPHLDEWAQAVLAHASGDHSHAIRLYRRLLAAQPEAINARFQLAVALFENNELEAATDQFQKLRSEPTLSQQSKAMLQRYLDAIAQQDRWTFSAGITYLNEPNINNAPKAGTVVGNWRAPDPESAQGIDFYADLGKKWSWGQGFYHYADLLLNGKYYWNNKKYNEFSSRLTAGMGWNNAKHDISLAPFVEQMHYAGGMENHSTLHRFSRTNGAQISWQYWLADQWWLSNEVEYGSQRYQTRKHLNGHYQFASSTLNYLRHAKQRWFIGINGQKSRPRDKDDRFVRKGIRVGWVQEWQGGLSSRLILSYARKDYQAPMPIFNLTQHNKEYGLNLSLWHRAIHYFGITPRITWNYQKVKSNHPFYRYDKQRLFLEFSKQF